MIQNVVEANRERSFYLTDRQNVYFIPKGWCDAWSVADGFSGGLDFINEDGEAEPEIYCYAPTHSRPNSPVDTLFVSVADLQKLVEIDEMPARKLHRELFLYLEKINAGENV